MQDDLRITKMIRWDRKVDCTYVSVRISAPSAIFNSKKLNWENYVEACRQSLYRLATQESTEILVWSVDLDWEDELTLITHQVYARGLLPGALPMRFARALQPARGYLTVELLARALEQGWPAERLLKYHVESNRVQRHDRAGRRLEDPIPEQLLARAVSDTGWRRLISPTDKPWAFINETTQRIFEREYADRNRSTALQQKYASASSQRRNGKQADFQPTGDELVIENILGILTAAACTTDSISVLTGRARGKKWRDLPEYLTGETGTSWDRRRVEAARASFVRRKGELRAAALASSQWKPRPNGQTVYRERLPDGSSWNGLWTYSHVYQGEEPEVLRNVMAKERVKLFSRA